IDVRVVHVVRDSRAVAYSWGKQVRRPDTDADSYMSRYSPAKAALQWIAQNGALHLLARRGAPTLRVAYEELVAAPEAALRRIARFAGLGADGAALGFLGGDSTGRWA